MWLRRPERPSVEPIRVTLFRKQGCGLCDQAEAMLRRISKRTPLQVTTVDIDSDEALQRRYFMEIPVVVVDGAEVARAPISERALADLFEGLAAG
ncbi:MAG: glutaredoxin family protein [Dehalococcoidia bacterium]|jgi:glutaredoxin